MIHALLGLPDSAGVEVHYTLLAEPRSSIPRMMCRGMLRSTARQLLEQVRAEMLRRKAGPR